MGQALQNIWVVDFIKCRVSEHLQICGAGVNFFFFFLIIWSQPFYYYLIFFLIWFFRSRGRVAENLVGMKCRLVCKVGLGVNDFSWYFCCETWTKKHWVRNEVCAALALALGCGDAGYRGGKINTWLSIYYFVWSFSGVWWRWSLGKTPPVRLSALALQCPCSLGVWVIGWGAVRLSAERNISPRVKPHQLRSIFVLLYWIFGPTDLEKVGFPPLQSLCFLLLSIFLWKKPLFPAPPKISEQLFLGLNAPNVVLNCSSALWGSDVGAGPSLPFCLG